MTHAAWASSSENGGWHHRDVATVMSKLGSSPLLGLSGVEAAQRLIRWGPNALPKARGRSLWQVLVAQFKSPLISLLFVAAGIAFAVGERADAAVILFVVCTNAIIGALQEGRAERSMEGLRRLAAVQCRVVRDGHEQMMASHLLVPGDVVLLSAGDAIAADARLVEAASLEVSEATLTGESLAVMKQTEAVPAEAVLGDRRSMVYAGTQVSAGRGRAVVVGTGLSSEIGKIAELTRDAEEPKTPLERRIERLGRSLALGACGVFLFVLGMGLWRGLPFAEVLMVAISQLVSIVPEGLPVAMTVGLAVGMQKMAARNVIVRRLSAVESLGSTTVICSDKTGTLTRNEMTAVAIVLEGGSAFHVTGSGYLPTGQFLSLTQTPVRPFSEPRLWRLLEAVSLCNDARLEAPLREGEAWRAVGDPTEVALLVLAKKAGMDTEALRRAHPRRFELPFSTETKVMATAHPGGVYLKGAPEAVLRLCGLDEAARLSALGHAERLAQQALRVLAVAECTFSPDAPFPLSDLRGRCGFLGLVGQLDPPREEVREAVALCRKAGIRTVMVTGDHRMTGLAIAQALGIARADEQAIDGSALDRASEETPDAVLRQVPVFARVHPAQKVRIVKLLQAAGEVVAMTGDGVNDAPALACADVGVAMGITGTEVAKEASKIVIADDHFATIVRAVEEGRIVYRNIKKVVLLLLSTGIAEVLILGVSLAMGFPLPFVAVQILWNNVVTEGTITVNLAMEPREGDEMHRPPTPRDEPLLTGPMLLRMGLMSVTITVTTLGYFIYQLSSGVSLEYARTATFTLLAVCEWFNVLNCRSDLRSALSLSVLKNRWLLGGLLVSVVLQFLVVFTPFMNRIFHTVPIQGREVFWIGAVGSVVLWVDEGRKLWNRQSFRRQN